MPFNPDEFNTVGIKIAAGGTEAELRTGISRIYYYLFLHAREQLLVRGLVNAGQIRRKGSHKAVITAIRKINMTLGNQLDALKDLRVQADYHLNPRPQYGNWPKNWSRCRAISQAIEDNIRNL